MKREEGTTDVAHEFRLSKEIELDATPEQIWDAIATGPGIDAWFMGRTELEGAVGGTLGHTIAGHTATAEITAWEPGHRFAHEGGSGDFFTAIEYIIEAREGGSTVLRLVQSGILGDNWETEFEAMQEGWDMYLHTLAQYLTHFHPRPATVVTAIRPGVPPRPDLWPTLLAALSVTTPVTEGAPARFSIAGTSVEGTVDYDGLPTVLGIRTQDALLRFLHSGPDRGNVLVLGHHLFNTPDPDKAHETWNTWLTHLLP
ncbi:SRPBCC domain-containing protein [Sphaerisporangium sp. B11E5]|uniref:SRPBCC family protein n=1 Tax=Sphaerisporangium sp. B11E5 TaxID=3153563 RepID=UPI00325E6F4D